MTIVLVLAVLSLAAAAAAVRAGEPALAVGPGGLHSQPWFHDPSGDLGTDLAAAGRAGKMLALVWEQEGCVYCREMHQVNLQVPEIVDYIRRHFYVVQLDMRGARAIVDFDGKALDEAALARRHRVFGTPSIEFRRADEREVYHLPGYAQPAIFKLVFTYVVEKGFETSGLRDWLMARLKAQEDKG
ncbi:MAG: thioredoxin family protein [Alphaproteobacteria bacterium]|nr:thioredoxin family protein [Alphaproteobacteria bacterium]